MLNNFLHQSDVSHDMAICIITCIWTHTYATHDMHMLGSKIAKKVEKNYQDKVVGEQYETT